MFRIEDPVEASGLGSADAPGILTPVEFDLIRFLPVVRLGAFKRHHAIRPGNAAATMLHPDRQRIGAMEPRRGAR
jgi:hypothetical protein